MSRVSGDAYRNTYLCVDSYEHGVMRGRWYNPGLEGGGRTFDSLAQFLTGAETLFDRINFPQSYTAKRVFAPISWGGASTPQNLGPPTGKRGTFLIRLLFRQHTSWQGIVIWTEGKGEQTFRSVLELVLLIDSALGGCGEVAV